MDVIYLKVMVSLQNQNLEVALQLQWVSQPDCMQLPKTNFDELFPLLPVQDQVLPATTKKLGSIVNYKISHIIIFFNRINSQATCMEHLCNHPIEIADIQSVM